MFDKVKLGLALGAGGARGLAHLGVLKAFEESGVRVSFIAGSSIGALVGGAYAVCRNAADLENRLMEFLEGDYYESSGLGLVRDALADRAESFPQRLETWLKRAYLQAKFVSRPAVMDSKSFRDLIDFFIPKIRIEDLPMPFWAVGTDLKSGRPVVFKSGPLREAVYASAAIPGLVKPLETGGCLVADGGVVNMVPALHARYMGADVVVAVDVEKAIELEDAEFGSAVDVLFRVEEVQNYYIRELQLREADLILAPRVGHIHWSEFERATEMIRLGQDEAYLYLDSIRTLARRRLFFRRRKRRLPLPGRAWIVI